MPPNQGEVQEARVRSRLVAEGYQQPYGASDVEIRRNLDISGKCADFVGYHPELDRWLIAESKGSDLEQAEEQLASTWAALLAREPSVIGKVVFEVHIKADQYDKLRGAGLSGYRLREEDPFLGSYDDFAIWRYSEIDGIKVLAVKESG